MNKKEFIDELSARTGQTKAQSGKALDAVLELLAEQMAKHETVRFVNFGTFEGKAVPERMGRNPKTNELVIIPATYRPIFKAGETLRDKVAGKA